MNRASRRLAMPHIGRKTQDPSQWSGQGTGLNAHHRVAKLAKEMAHECYDVHMSANNALYRAFRKNLTEGPARTAFVTKVAPTLLEDARRALTMCLALPDDQMPVSEKDKIAEALILDSDLRANRLIATDVAMASGLIH